MFPCTQLYFTERHPELLVSDRLSKEQILAALLDFDDREEQYVKDVIASISDESMALFGRLVAINCRIPPQPAWEADESPDEVTSRLVRKRVEHGLPPCVADVTAWVQCCQQRSPMRHVVQRCRAIMRELMAVTWHPSRMREWCLPFDDEFAIGCH